MVSDETMEIFVAVAEMNENIEKLRLETKGDLLRLEDRLSGEISRLESRLMQRFEKLDGMFGMVNEKFEKIDGKISKIDEKQQNDFRILFGAIITAVLGLGAVLAHGFKWF